MPVEERPARVRGHLKRWRPSAAPDEAGTSSQGIEDDGTGAGDPGAADGGQGRKKVRFASPPTEAYDYSIITPPDWPSESPEEEQRPRRGMFRGGRYKTKLSTRLLGPPQRVTK